MESPAEKDNLRSVNLLVDIPLKSVKKESMQERNGEFIDPRISAARHFTEASKKVSDLTPALAAFVSNPVVLTALVFPLYELYQAGKDEIAFLRNKQSLNK